MSIKLGSPGGRRPPGSPPDVSNEIVWAGVSVFIDDLTAIANDPPKVISLMEVSRLVSMVTFEANFSSLLLSLEDHCRKNVFGRTSYG